MTVEFSTETLTEEGGADGAVCVRERVRNRGDRETRVFHQQPLLLLPP